jgi:hypothetical protein
VYIYFDLLSNKPFYVGKGKGDRHKLYSHSRKVQAHLVNKIEKLGRDNVKVQIGLSGLTNEEAKSVERILIALYGRSDLGKGPLLNKTDGGDVNCGWKMPDETKDKIRSAMARRALSDWKPACYWKGKSRSPEDKEKISKSVSIAMKGFRKGIPKTAEAKRNMSIAAKKRVVTQEFRLLMKDAALKGWVTRRRNKEVQK